jgi:hypothetical protein
MAAEYPTIGQGADTKVLVPLEDWKAIQAKLRKEEILSGIAESYQEAQDLISSGAKGKERHEFMRKLREESERDDD